MNVLLQYLTLYFPALSLQHLSVEHNILVPESNFFPAMMDT
jgi:hypothetical protein